ncbi:hypothetical protein [Prosthecobacter sp.]|uniref:hypothetical protein n=1 Tax=Prosthecobacter sp. TaxID=1965333 RepID=UPI0024879D64|nr:hypothetical protein [Prosthecobacter sp.]MDI1313342.1 hypothetical protein [Prosthecobacter sp.]
MTAVALPPFAKIPDAARLVSHTPLNLWFSRDSSPAEGCIYHNTITGGEDPAVVFS